MSRVFLTCKISLLFLVSILVFWKASFAIEPVSYGDLTAHVFDNRKYRLPIKVIIHGKDSSSFTGERTDFIKIWELVKADFNHTCPDARRVEIFGVIDHKVSYRGHATLDDGWRLVNEFYSDVTTPVKWDGPEDPRSWTTHLIGTWRGRLWKDEIEIALWVPVVSNTPQPYLQGFARTTDGTCTYESGPNIMTHYYAFQLPPEKELYDKIHLRYRIINHSISENRNSRGSRQEGPSCEYRAGQLEIFVDMKTGRVFANPGDFRQDGPTVLFYPFERVNASPAMTTILNRSDRNKRFAGPTMAQKALILYKDEPFSKYKSQIPVSCMVDYQYALSKLRTAGINIVEAFPLEDQNTVEVKMQEMPSFKNKSVFYPRDAGIDWYHLSMGKSEKLSASSACEAAGATLAFLSKRNNNKIAAKKDQHKSALKIDNIDQYYLIDKGGIDLMTKYNNHSAGRADRACGSSTVFWPGDKTREFRWNIISQKIIIQNYVKSVIDRKIVKDIFNDWDDRKVVFDGPLSKLYKAPVFSSVDSKYNEDICYEWRGKVHVDTCLQVVKKGTVKKKIYLTKSKEAAIGIFKKISPNKATWIGLIEDSDTCPGGPFCELAAGDYLNAIYRADYRAIRDMEDRALKGLNDTLRSLSFGNEIMVEVFENITGRANRTLLPFALNEYMYGYQTRPLSCFKKGALQVEYKDRTADLVFTDVYPDWGLEIETGRISGRERYARYLINPEFRGACSELCSVRGSNETMQFIDAILNEKNALGIKIYDSFRDMENNYGCRSPEVEQFEKNLLQLYYYNKIQLMTQSYQRNTW